MKNRVNWKAVAKNFSNYVLNVTGVMEDSLLIAKKMESKEKANVYLDAVLTIIANDLRCLAKNLEEGRIE